MKKAIWAMAFAGLIVTGLAMAQETAPASELKVDQAVVAKDVQNRAPVEPGEKFSADVGKVFFFNKISGAKGETQIKHVWYKGDKVVGEIPLTINGPTWRTWSTKTIDKSMTGAWKVEIQDADGKVLATVNFTIE